MDDKEIMRAAIRKAGLTEVRPGVWTVPDKDKAKEKADADFDLLRRDGESGEEE